MKKIITLILLVGGLFSIPAIAQRNNNHINRQRQVDKQQQNQRQSHHRKQRKQRKNKGYHRGDYYRDNYYRDNYYRGGYNREYNRLIVVYEYRYVSRGRRVFKETYRSVYTRRGRLVSRVLINRTRVKRYDRYNDRDFHNAGLRFNIFLRF